jgi:hypothetical protein
MSGTVIPNTYSGSAPGVTSFNGGFAAVWKRPGNSGKIWWGSIQPELKFNVWLTHGLIHEIADADAAPAIAQIPGTSHLLVAWKGTGFLLKYIIPFSMGLSGANQNLRAAIRPALVLH